MSDDKKRVPPANYWHYHLKNSLKTLTLALRMPMARRVPVSHPITFVAGCGHSGTTMVAARLGQHPEVFLVGRESGVLRKHYRVAYATVLAQEWALFATHLGRSQVLEKTPRHIYVIPFLQRLIPHARFILVVRNPMDTVTSLYERFGSLDRALNRWLLDNRQLLKHRKLSNTKTVFYENLTQSPERTFRDLTAFLQLPWSEQIMAPQETEYLKFDNGGLMQTRSEQVSQPIKPNQGKWKSFLTDEEAKYVRRKTRQMAIALGYQEEDLW